MLLLRMVASNTTLSLVNQHKELMENHTEQDRARSGLQALLGALDAESDLVGYAHRAAVATLGKNWLDAIGDGSRNVLIHDVDDLIVKLQTFKAQARVCLPICNGGWDGYPMSFWMNRLDMADIYIYQADRDSPHGLFGFTGCDADIFTSFDAALSAALVANPDIVDRAKGEDDEHIHQQDSQLEKVYP